MHPTKAWRPGASLAMLRLRAEVLAEIRAFFAARGVLEVETPILSPATIPDPTIESFTSGYLAPGQQVAEALYLHTSPEFPMKRLLAAGSGPIYQVARVFRQGELGVRHNPEFSLLEWYRPGFDHLQLMDEVACLVQQLIEHFTGKLLAVSRVSYAELFLDQLQLDPHSASLNELRGCAMTHGIDYRGSEEGRDFWLQLLLTHLLEPRLGRDGPEFLYHYPASQAALARLTDDAPPVAARFELYWQGVELCNGFHELCDAGEQRQRFAAELAERAELGLSEVALDERFLAALEAGMPQSAGVAMGLDRLLMLLGGVESLDQVMAFSHPRA